ncbi:MAG: hypothetical protein ACFHVJ_14900 [Aestuariibacter sp.]
MRVFGTIICLILLTACGGGSGTGSNIPAPSPAPSPAPPVSDEVAISVSGPTAAKRGEAVGLAALLNTQSENYQFQWQQISGPSVTILAAHSQAIGFDVEESGDYSFEVTATHKTTSEQVAESFAFSVAEETKTAQVRLDHAVVEQGPVSLRVDVPENERISSITWRQTAGPTVSASSITQQEQFLFFTAPSVTSDQIVQFEATITTASGINDSDSSMVLIKNTTVNSNGYFPGVAESVVYSEMFPYRNASPYATALQNCVYNNQIDASCNFSQLPLIGQVTESPTIEDVLSRLLVSHQWMGDRFKEYLENSIAAPDMLALLRGVTAVVISYEVRPSFYWVATGAIYLDARNFWVTPEERDTLNDIPDYRSDFGNDLQFIMPWRYVKNGANYLNRSDYPQEQRLSRTFTDVEADITWLMYHELAHANDFFPPDVRTTLTLNTSPLGYFNNNDARSSAFSEQYPLRSQEMNSLADVRFRGNAANATQKAYTADDVELFFRPDDAAMFYSYLTTREDYATLFERFMMAYRFEAYADTAIMAKDNNPEFLVTWGQRNRIMEQRIQPRTLYSVENIYPELPAQQILAEFPPAQLMTPDTSWFDNLILDNQQKRSTTRTPGATSELMEGVHHLHTGRPGVPGTKN